MSKGIRFLKRIKKRLRSKRVANNNDVIPFEEIEKEILSLPPEKMGPIFAHVHLVLGGNSVWFKHYKKLEMKVCNRIKKREEELRRVQNLFVAGDYVLVKSVGTENNNPSNEDHINKE